MKTKSLFRESLQKAGF